MIYDTLSFSHARLNIGCVASPQHHTSGLSHDLNKLPGATPGGPTPSLLPCPPITATSLSTVSRHVPLFLQVQNDLLGEFDGVVNDQSLADQSLSKRLAYRGILPMFGFPTRVRLLHHGPPWPRPWPPDDSIDRDLDIAFANSGPKLFWFVSHNGCVISST